MVAELLFFMVLVPWWHIHSKRNPIVENHVSCVGGHSFCSWFITEVLPHLPIRKHFQASHGGYTLMDENKNWIISFLRLLSILLLFVTRKKTSSIWLNVDTCVFMEIIYFIVMFPFWKPFFFWLLTVADILKLYRLPGMWSRYWSVAFFVKGMQFLCCPECLFFFHVFDHRPKSLLDTSVRLCIVHPLVWLCVTVWCWVIGWPVSILATIYKSYTIRIHPDKSFCCCFCSPKF